MIEMKFKVSFKDIKEKATKFFGTRRGLIVAFVLVAAGSYSLALMSRSEKSGHSEEREPASSHESMKASHSNHHEEETHGEKQAMHHEEHQANHDDDDDVMMSSEDHAAEEEKMHEKQAPKNVVEKLFAAVQGIQHTADELSRADMENFRLRLENANLRQWAESLRFNCAGKFAQDKTEKLEGQLKDQTGTEVGRTLASIDYRPPPHLLPDQLYTLGVSYFDAKEFEKSAVIFTFLTGLEEYPGFQTAQNYLMTGVSWYKIDHMSLAKSFFEKSLFKAEQDWKVFEDTRSTDHSRAAQIKRNQVQSRLWQALVARRMSNNAESQDWLKQVIGRHPSSIEAAWVNPAGRTNRKTQSNDGAKHDSNH